MFGYLTIHKEKLSEEDRRVYQGYYCGLCGKLGEKFGRKSQLILAYDPVFLAVLYAGLYEEADEITEGFCLYKGSRVPKADTKALAFAADMNLLLGYQNFRDQAQDSASLRARKAVGMLKKEYEETAARYPVQKKCLESYMEKLTAYENAPDDNPDTAANLTGEMTQTVFLREQDEFSEYLGGMFYSLGKFIYLCDAYCDLEEDRKSGSYNPYLKMSSDEHFEEKVRWHLESIMEDCTRCFEMLPLFRYREILRNILYSGIWMAYAKAAKTREESKKGK